jgi:hypothetical protein
MIRRRGQHLLGENVFFSLDINHLLQTASRMFHRQIFIREGHARMTAPRHNKLLVVSWVSLLEKDSGSMLDRSCGIIAYRAKGLIHI